MYELLKIYERREGNCLVPYEHKEGSKKLGTWVSTQRDAYNAGTFLRYWKQLLDDVGFVWDAL